LGSLGYGSPTPIAPVIQYQDTGGLKNGRFWIGLSPGERIGFIIGFDQARALGSLSDTYWPDGSTAGEVAKGVDQFYEDPANVALHVGAALSVFYWKVHGDTAEQLAAYTAALRSEASDQTARDAAKKK